MLTGELRLLASGCKTLANAKSGNAPGPSIAVGHAARGLGTGDFSGELDNLDTGLLFQAVSRAKELGRCCHLRLNSPAQGHLQLLLIRNPWREQCSCPLPSPTWGQPWTTAPWRLASGA